MQTVLPENKSETCKNWWRSCMRSGCSEWASKRDRLLST